jgi:hypothetical protein
LGSCTEAWGIGKPTGPGSFGASALFVAVFFENSHVPHRLLTYARAISENMAGSRTTGPRAILCFPKAFCSVWPADCCVVGALCNPGLRPFYYLAGHENGAKEVRGA